LHLVVSQQCGVELLGDGGHQLAQHVLAVAHQVLVAAQREPVSELSGGGEHLTVDVAPVGHGLVERVVEAPVQRCGDRARMADDAHEDGVREDLTHLLHVGGVERGLVTPAGLPLRLRVALEHARVELAEAGVELLLGPADPVEPLRPVLPAGDASGREQASHEAGLGADRDPRVAVEDETQHRRARAHRADDEDRCLIHARHYGGRRKAPGQLARSLPWGAARQGR